MNKTAHETKLYKHNYKWLISIQQSSADGGYCHNCVCPTPFDCPSRPCLCVSGGLWPVAAHYWLVRRGSTCNKPFTSPTRFTTSNDDATDQNANKHHAMLTFSRNYATNLTLTLSAHDTLLFLSLSLIFSRSIFILLSLKRKTNLYSYSASSFVIIHIYKLNLTFPLWPL